MPNDVKQIKRQRINEFNELNSNLHKLTPLLQKFKSKSRSVNKNRFKFVTSNRKDVRSLVFVLLFKNHFLEANKSLAELLRIGTKQIVSKDKLLSSVYGSLGATAK